MHKVILTLLALLFSVAGCSFTLSSSGGWGSDGPAPLMATSGFRKPARHAYGGVREHAVGKPARRTDDATQPAITWTGKAPKQAKKPAITWTGKAPKQAKKPAITWAGKAPKQAKKPAVTWSGKAPKQAKKPAITWAGKAPKKAKKPAVTWTGEVPPIPQ